MLIKIFSPRLSNDRLSLLVFFGSANFIAMIPIKVSKTNKLRKIKKIFIAFSWLKKSKSLKGQ